MPGKLIHFLLLLAFSLWVAGCASTRELEVPETATMAPPVKGVYHKVGPGETIWSIAKAYNVSIEDIIKTNSIPNVALLEKNQLILIPGADRVREIPPETGAVDDGEFKWPVKGRLVGYFGERRGSRVNRGIDIQANEGDQVLAARSGTVVFSDFLRGYAYTIILDHSDGYYTVYSQNAKLLAKLDQKIVRGTPIAVVGKNNGASCVHFEVRHKTIADNPLYYLP